MPALAAPKENLYLSGGEPPAEKHFRPPTEVAKAPSAFISSVKLIGATAFRIFRIAALWAQKIAVLVVEIRHYFIVYKNSKQKNILYKPGARRRIREPMVRRRSFCAGAHRYEGIMFMLNI